MLTSGKAVKVSIYLSDGAKHHGVPVYTSLLDFLFGAVELNDVSHALEVAQTRANDVADLQEIRVAQAVTDKERGPRDQHCSQVGCDDRILLEESVVVPLGDNNVLLMALIAVQTSQGTQPSELIILILLVILALVIFLKATGSI